MSVIRKFEEIRAWQVARQLANAIYKTTGTGAFSRDFGLKDQIRRAAGSVMHNIAEGFDSGSDAEFKRFLRIALRSISEVQSQLYLALDLNYLDREQFDKLYAQAEQVKGLTRKFVLYLANNKRSNGLSEPDSQYSVSDAEGIELTLDDWTLDYDEN